MKYWYQSTQGRGREQMDSGGKKGLRELGSGMVCDHELHVICRMIEVSEHVEVFINRSSFIIFLHRILTIYHS